MPTDGTFVIHVVHDDQVLRKILKRLKRLETLMGTLDDNLATLTGKIDSLSASNAAIVTAFTDLAADVRAFLEQAQSGEVTPEQQAQFDALSASLDSATASAATAVADVAALDAEVGDADGSDTPPPVEPTP